MANGLTKEEAIRQLKVAQEEREKLRGDNTELRERIEALEARLQELEEKEKAKGETDPDFNDW